MRSLATSLGILAVQPPLDFLRDGGLFFRVLVLSGGAFMLGLSSIKLLRRSVHGRLPMFGHLVEDAVLGSAAPWLINGIPLAKAIWQASP